MRPDEEDGLRSIGQVLVDIGWPAKLMELAKRIDRNVPDHRRPTTFHEEKSEIVHELEQIAQEART
jgi:hypothetical protein